MLAAGKGHRPSQALLGHMLFVGDGVPPQRARGLMWLTIAKNGADGAKDEWIRDLYQSDFAAATADDRKAGCRDARRARQGPAAALVHLPKRRQNAADSASARRADAGRRARAAAGGIGASGSRASSLCQARATNATSLRSGSGLSCSGSRDGILVRIDDPAVGRTSNGCSRACATESEAKACASEGADPRT